MLQRFSRLIVLTVLPSIWLALPVVAVGCSRVHNAPAATPHIVADTQAPDTARTHLDAAGKAIEAAKPEATPKGQQLLAVASTHVEQAKPAVDTSKAEIQRLTDQLNDANARGDAADRNAAQAAADRDAAIAKYDSAWLGGRAWAWIRGITATLVVLVVLGLILNAKTDLFVWAAGPLHFAWDLVLDVFAGAAKLVGQLFKYKGKPGALEQPAHAS